MCLTSNCSTSLVLSKHNVMYSIKISPLVDTSHCVVMVQYYRSWQLVGFTMTVGKYHTVPSINLCVFDDQVTNFIAFSRLVKCTNRGNPFSIFRRDILSCSINNRIYIYIIAQSNTTVYSVITTKR